MWLIGIGKKEKKTMMLDRFVSSQTKMHMAGLSTGLVVDQRERE